MIVIGLTGATGAGKGFFGSYASEKYNIFHIDTDKTSREVTQKGSKCLEEICTYFGKDVLLEDGTLDRKKLGKLVFSDKDKLIRLNEITHKYISEEVKNKLNYAKNNSFDAAIIDAPLLFESGENEFCNVTVGIVADRETRKKRIMERDFLDEETADNRIKSGKDVEFFKERCDYIIENNADAKEYEKKISEILEFVLNGDI